jgi:hypothetical protein
LKRESPQPTCQKSRIKAIASADAIIEASRVQRCSISIAIIIRAGCASFINLAITVII